MSPKLELVNRQHGNMTRHGNVAKEIPSLPLESDTFFQSAGLKLKLPNRTFQEISNVSCLGKWMKAVFENMFYCNVPLPLPAHQHRSLQKMEDIIKAAPEQCSCQTLNGQ